MRVLTCVWLTGLVCLLDEEEEAFVFVRVSICSFGHLFFDFLCPLPLSGVDLKQCGPLAVCSMCGERHLIGGQ